MNKLMKSELFLLRKSGNYLAYLIIIAILPIFLVFVAFNEIFSHDFYTGTNELITVFIFLIMISTATLAITISRKYDNRTANYAVMDGNKPSKIILAILFSYLPVALVMFVLPSLIMLMTLFRNGVGDTDNPLLMIVLMIVIFIRIYSSTILVSTIFKSAIDSAIYTYKRTAFDYAGKSLVLEVISTTYPEKYDFVSKIGDLFAPVQLESLLTKYNDTTYILTVLASFIIDIALCYVVALYTYKKKMFK